MISHTLLVGTCIASLVAFGSIGKNEAPLPAAHALTTLAVARPASVESRRRDAMSDYDIAKVYAEGSLHRAQERCDAQGADMSDSCKDLAKNAYEDVLAAAGERLADATREIAALPN